MTRAQNVTLRDRQGNRLRARLLTNGHILLSEHAHRYTYARINRRGDIELYDDDGNFSFASLDGGGDDGSDADEEPAGLACAA
jgi:hypothetical protein